LRSKIRWRNPKLLGIILPKSAATEPTNKTRIHHPGRLGLLSLSKARVHSTGRPVRFSALLAVAAPFLALAGKLSSRSNQ
jgi:hypothetical protein